MVGARGFEPPTPRSRTDLLRRLSGMILRVFELRYRQRSDLLADNVRRSPNTPVINIATVLARLYDSKACRQRRRAHREKQTAVGDFGGAPFLGGAVRQQIGDNEISR